MKNANCFLKTLERGRERERHVYIFLKTKAQWKKKIKKINIKFV